MKLHCLTGVAAILLASTQVQYAIPITGNIGLTGGLTYDTSSAATATQVTSWINSQVTLDSGTFASILSGTPVTIAAPWKFMTTSPIMNFWTVAGFTFELLSSSVLSQGGTPGSTGYVAVQGTGIVSGNGYTATPISWMFTSQDPTASSSPIGWTFSTSSATQAVGVPDGASTVLLLGVALSGVAMIRRKTMTKMA